MSSTVSLETNGSWKLKVSREIADLIARRPKGRPLEAPFYTRDDIFNLDMKVIFKKHWICVGTSADVPEPGDYFTVEILNSSVILVRDDDEEIKAFHNTCCHRGARVLNEQKGTVGNLVCPYHQWTYNLDGQLMFAKHMGEDFQPKDYRLKPVHLRNLAGLLFICMDDNPPADFDDMAKTMAPYLAPHQINNTKVADEYEFIEDCNWKLTMENNRECYHCAVNHPELTSSLYEFGFGYLRSPEDQEEYDAYDRAVVESAEMWERACGLPSAEVEHLADTATGYRAQRLPLTQSGESQTLNTRAACKKLLGDFERADLGGLSFWTEPNAWFHFMSDHIVVVYFLPLSETRTLIHTTWLVHKEAIEYEDYDPHNLTVVWKATNEQDKHLVQISQRGVEDDGYNPGPYSPNTEIYVERFCEWYIKRLSALTTAG